MYNLVIIYNSIWEFAALSINLEFLTSIDEILRIYNAIKHSIFMGIFQTSNNLKYVKSTKGAYIVLLWINKSIFSTHINKLHTRAPQN